MFGQSILFSEMTPAPDWAGEFNDWYDKKHIPNRMAAPGFISARRYRADPLDYLAVYEMDSPEVLLTDVYNRIKTQPDPQTRRILGDVSGFTRYIGRQIAEARKPSALFEQLDAPVLYAVWFDVPAERLGAFDAWYDHDHVPILMGCPSWMAVRRFDIVDAEPQRANRLALHYLSTIDALQSPERAHARTTAWRAKLAAESWFQGRYKVFSECAARQMAVGQSGENGRHGSEGRPPVDPGAGAR